jgi:hypothetical protein
MDLRLYCNSLTKNADHTMVVLAAHSPFGQHFVKLFLPHAEAAAFKPGSWLAVNFEPLVPQAAPAPEKSVAPVQPEPPVTLLPT